MFERLDLAIAESCLHPNMLSCENIFVDFIGQLSQQHSHGAELIGLQSRRIQRSLRSIDAAQGGCWTAPCSPAVPAFREISSTQSEAPVIRDAFCAEVHRWHDPTLFSVISEVLNSFTSPGRQADRYRSYLLSPLLTAMHRIRPMMTRHVDTARRHLHPLRRKSLAL